MDDAIEPVLPNDPNDAVYFDVEYAGHEAEMAPQPEDADILQNDPLSFDADDLEGDAQRWASKPSMSESQDSVQWNETIAELREFHPTEPPASQPPRRSQRIRDMEAANTVKMALQAFAIMAQQGDEESTDLALEMTREVIDGAYKLEQSYYGLSKTVRKRVDEMSIEDLIELTDLKQIEGDIFEPAPEKWQEILTLPPHIQAVWKKGFKAEFQTLLREKAFEVDETSEDAPIIPVTAKMRVKILANGMLDKAKVRICLRGDLQK